MEKDRRCLLQGNTLYRHLPRETEVVKENISIMIVCVQAEITIEICNHFRLKCVMSCVFCLNVKRS